MPSGNTTACNKLRIARLSICNLNGRYFKMPYINSRLCFWYTDHSFSLTRYAQPVVRTYQIHSKKDSTSENRYSNADKTQS